MTNTNVFTTCVYRPLTGSVKHTMRFAHYLFHLLPFLSCSVAPAQENRNAHWPSCPNVPPEVVEHVRRVLTDSTDLFRGAYPPATPLTCELLEGLQEVLKDDSVRYCFERLSRKYWSEDAAARITFTYIDRHLDFNLAIAAAAHWNEDHRIRGLRALQDYRRMRPMVCSTKDHYAELEEQDRQAVRYLLRVLETTPLFIPGSENSTIHGVYMTEVMRTLDGFTDEQHITTGDQRMTLDMSESQLEQAIADWRKWLEQ